MFNYVLRRFLIAIPSLLGISAILFGVLALAPGDPFEELAQNPNVSGYAEARIQALLPGADTTNVTGGQSYIIDQILRAGPGAEYNSDLDRRNGLRIILKKVPGALDKVRPRRG